MNIDDLTLGQIKELTRLTVLPEPPAMNNGMIGKYVIVRCRDAGVHAGRLEAHNGRECILTESRRLWRWQVPSGESSFLSGVAQAGLADDSRLGCSVERIHLTENCEIIQCSDSAEKSIREWPVCNRD